MTDFNHIDDFTDFPLKTFMYINPFFAVARNTFRQKMFVKIILYAKLMRFKF